IRFCSSLILASLTSTGAGLWPNQALPFETGIERLPPVSHMIRTINAASPKMNQDWTFFGSRPTGFGALSWIGSFMGSRLFAVGPPRKRELLAADGEVSAIEDFGDDVHTVLELKRNQIWLAVFHLIKGRLFPRRATNEGEGVVVVDQRNQERLARRAGLDGVVELKFFRVFGAKSTLALGDLRARHTNLLGGLCAKRFELFLVGFCIRGANITLQSGRARGFLRFDKKFKVRFDIGLIADFGEREGIDMPSGCDEIEVAANAGLGRMHITEIVGAVDDPEFLVPGGEIEDLLVVGQNDERRETEFGPHCDNVFLGVLHHTRALTARTCRKLRAARNPQNAEHHSAKNAPAMDEIDLRLHVSLLTECFARE